MIYILRHSTTWFPRVSSFSPLVSGDVFLEVIARLPLDRSVHVDMVDGAADVGEDGFVAHEEIFEFVAVRYPEKKVLFC